MTSEPSTSTPDTAPLEARTGCSTKSMWRSTTEAPGAGCIAYFAPLAEMGTPLR